MPGVGQLFNDSDNPGGPWAAPGGLVLGRDGQLLREMVATISLAGGDAVILDPANGLYNVTTSSISDDPKRYGIVVGSQLGVQAAAASAPVWVAIEGPAWAVGASNISVGDFIGITSLSTSLSGQATRAKSNVWHSGGVAGTAARQILQLGATVSLATSFVSFTTTDVNIAVTGFLATDIPLAFTPSASMPNGLVIGELINAGAASVQVRIGNPTATAVVSQASMPGTLTFSRGSSLGLPGTVVGVALTSTGATGGKVQIFVNKG